MAKMTIDPEDRARLVLTRDEYGNLVGQELPSPDFDLQAWIRGNTSREVRTSHAYCPDCKACVDGSWEGARAKCRCGWVGYFPTLRFSKRYV